jgi:hypothetical protein
LQTAPIFVFSRFEIVILRQNDVGAVCIVQKQLFQFPSAGLWSCTTRFTNSKFDGEQTTSVFGARGERCGGRAARWAATSVGRCATSFISSVCCGVADIAANARRRRLAQQSPPVLLRKHGQGMRPVPLMLCSRKSEVNWILVYSLRPPCSFGPLSFTHSRRRGSSGVGGAAAGVGGEREGWARINSAQQTSSQWTAQGDVA